MTRINTVDVTLLLDQHLMAEYRELTMVNSSLRRSIESLRKKRYTGTKLVQEILKKVPSNYTLNKGHVSFFYDKGTFLSNRYELLINELVKRGYNLDPNRVASFESFEFDESFKKDWTPSLIDIKINAERIVQRYFQKPKFYTYIKTRDFDVKKLYGEYYNFDGVE